MILLMLAACLPFPSDRDRITAGDLAAIEPVFSALPPDAMMGYAPTPGVRRVFGVAELGRRARQYGVTIEPERDLCVERPVEPLSRDAVLGAMRASLAIPEAHIEIVELNHYPVPRGVLDFPLAGLIARPASQPHAMALWKGFVRYGGNQRFAVWARVRISVNMDLVVATDNLRSGQPIERTQLKLENRDSFPMHSPPLRSLDQAVGRIPRRSVAAGKILYASELDPPFDVIRGDPVRVDVSSGDAHLVLDGRADASARRGQTVPVINPSNGRRFAAHVEGAGRVSVETRP